MRELVAAAAPTAAATTRSWVAAVRRTIGSTVSAQHATKPLASSPAISSDESVAASPLARVMPIDLSFAWATFS